MSRVRCHPRTHIQGLLGEVWEVGTETPEVEGLKEGMGTVKLLGVSLHPLSGGADGAIYGP